ncbi:phage baseplate assembly protein V [Tumebacillus permanentifrigoris]|uniref:Type VI secretion system (T6SS) baseplate-like injector VgrG n=1 Tax=Tumebacillus permanentifrigoris TaxID=378543 RepID=A0A316D733_9BACL|nr:phage baseplate assembly protein V [Tumebacillus permanentifrigoris]PWK11530.1 type VI secretion system (T6SS) baseplate-like injector VgrG [Tumebacillus permanentifrigoris]
MSFGDFDFLGGGFSSSGQASSNRISGVLVGVVTDNKDPENLARVKLKFPIREGEEVTDWARVASLMAGSDRGSLFIPEVGDEVLVAFHLGDVSQPYVIGALWNKDQAAPKGDADKNNIRKFRSRSGHEILFNDDGEQGNVQILTSKGHQVLIDDKADTITISDAKSKNVIEIKGGDSGKITVTSAGSGASAVLTLAATGDVTLNGAKSIKVESPQINIESSGMLNLKASGNIQMESNAMVTIKGSMVKIN